MLRFWVPIRPDTAVPRQRGIPMTAQLSFQDK